jgi:hypothetical protein
MYSYFVSYKARGEFDDTFVKIATKAINKKGIEVLRKAVEAQMNIPAMEKEHRPNFYRVRLINFIKIFNDKGIYD